MLEGLMLNVIGGLIGVLLGYVLTGTIFLVFHAPLRHGSWFTLDLITPSLVIDAFMLMITTVLQA
jgi:xanthine/uracil permease